MINRFGVLLALLVPALVIHLADGISFIDVRALSSQKNPAQPAQLADEPFVLPTEKFPPPSEQALYQVGSLQMRHMAGEVRSVGFSRDGRRLLSIGDNLGMHVWNPATGRELGYRRETSSSSYHVVTLSADSKLLAAAGAETCYLIDVEKRKVLHALSGLKFPAERVLFSRDGSLIAASTVERDAAVWDTATGKRLRHFARGGGSCGTCIAFAPDGSLLAYGDSFDGIVLWNPRTGTKARELGVKKNPDGITALGFAGDGKTLAAVYDLPKKRLALWEVVTGKLLREMPLDENAYPLLTADGRLFVVEGANPGVALRSPFDGKRVCRLDADAGFTALAISPDGKRLATGRPYDFVRLWDAGTRKLLFPNDGPDAHPNIWTDAVFCQDGKHLASSVLFSDAYRIWNAETGKLERTVVVSEKDFPTHTFHPESLTLTRTARDGTVSVYDVQTRRTLFQRKYPGQSASGLLSPDRKTLAVCYSANEGVPAAQAESRLLLDAWDVGTGRRRHFSVPADKGTSFGWRFAPDGKILLTVQEPSPFGERRGRAPDRLTYRFWDVGTGKLKSALETTPAGRCSFQSTFTARGKLFRVCHEQRKRNAYYLWDVGRGAKVAHSDEVTDFALNPREAESPRGKFELFSSGWTFYLRDTTMRKLHRLAVPGGRVFSSAFSPDERLIALGTHEGEIHVFHAATRAHLGKCVGHRGLVRRVSFSPDGQRLVSSSTDTTLIVWNLASFWKMVN